jgi:SNF2 family DNA or RNA helicase
MQVLHGTWIPNEKRGFVQSGAFHLWIESAAFSQSDEFRPQFHARTLPNDRLLQFIVEKLGIKLSRDPQVDLLSRYFLLPSCSSAPNEVIQPLPSPELARHLDQDLPQTCEWQFWQIDCYCPSASIKLDSQRNATVPNIIKLLTELHFVAQHQLADIQLGSDLLFWLHFTKFLKHVIFQDEYIPSLKYRSYSQATSEFEIYAGWEIVSAAYETELDRYAQLMPPICTAGFVKPPNPVKLHDPKTLLKHFSEVLLTQIVTHTPTTTAYDKQIAATVVKQCLVPGHPGRDSNALKQYQQWKQWRDRVCQSQQQPDFYLCFQLYSPDKPEDAWTLEFQVASKLEPSVRIPLMDYWRLQSSQQEALQQQFGGQFEYHLLLHLGYAARMYPKLWTGLENEHPTSVFLTAEEALEFLTEAAWILEDAGYKIIVPAWWTPQGWRRAKVRMKASSRSSTRDSNQNYLGLEALIRYQPELVIDDQSVSESEWQQLVSAKTPLVQFRGEWVHLDKAKMKQMLEFWKKHRHQPDLDLLDFMKLSAGSEEEIELEIDSDQTLAEMLAKLRDKTQLEILPDPKPLNGTLRPYQQRGVAWLRYLDQIGLNGYLADDMGTGKSFSVIARLVQEREDQVQISPTLLIAPTSVIGNWQKEIEKFAPQLRSHIHHGSDRISEIKEFRTAIAHCDVLITSYTLARKDEALFAQIKWHRIVIDEAQNIKNPRASQTKAICKLLARHRLALTGTPIENRLLDLWSIFNFLNPGYLGKEAQFRQSFESPIQKENDELRAATLKKLVEPFILRRVKTDPAIIQDLPDKVEQKLYCHLTKEQSSLYAAVVKDVEQRLEALTGMERRGLMLATLMKLKQICNHPRQFLQDDSDFTPARSHKLERLAAMTQEAIDEGESLLVFTQFTEIGEALERYFKQVQRCNAYYLHGGTPRKQRERMITEFQAPETEPSIFILSLKAGGVGITLTKANHVFHFDRWWNPAVENQASDRAFRLGQKKNVFVHKFVSLGTLGERIDQMIEDKQKLAGTIVGTDESWLTELDNEAFKQLISLNQTMLKD